jgi:DNA-binding XRE family transcriptional regulator
MSEIETVTLSRTEYEALIDRLEDAEDELAIRRFDQDIATRGIEAVKRDCLPAELVWRMVDGEHPIRIWRENRGVSGAKLAQLAGVPQSYISDIETGKKPGSVDAYRRLAGALDVQVDDLLPAVED